MILTKNNCVQNIKIKLNSGTWMTLQSSVMIFQVLEPFQPQWPLQPQQPQWPLWPRKPHFIKKTLLNLRYHPYHPNDQNQSLIVEWIIKNPVFYWYLVPFLFEAAEASSCYFFENWLMKLSKCPHLLKPLGNIIQQNYWFFYPSEPFQYDNPVANM